MTRTLALALLAALVAAPAARADTGNFDLGGKIYTKYMYKNDASQGCLSMSNPFWVDNIQGSNGACTEFELNVKARIGAKVTAGVRLQSRWGMIWQDWWENGDLKPGTIDTSGESLGMNHAAYMKLRGAFMRFAPPIPGVRWVTIGSTDYSMWDAWTIGKARYIDRDNGSGLFVEGDLLPQKALSYTVGAMALPKLWAGPGWQTGISGNDPKASFYGGDWAFAAKLESRMGEALRVKAIGTLLQDWEADKYSPFLTGDPSAARNADHSVAWATRFRGVNATLEAVYTPPQLEWLSVTGFGAVSSNYVNPVYATNLVTNGQGFSPVVFRKDASGRAVASVGGAGKLLVEAFDPWQNGLSLKLELFRIGSEYNAVMGARREADTLLTDGIITGGFTRGGQLPTLNVANEFVDWDEPWYETSIGWQGGTLVGEYASGRAKLSGEYTLLGYNTNAQGRDVKNQFPDFLYTHGFTDTSTFTADADYANKYDRGRDPRSVYAEWQDRLTHIAVLNDQYTVPSFSWIPTWLGGRVLAPFLDSLRLSTTAKLKYVHDRDNRQKANPNDDYVGDMYMGMLQLSAQPTSEWKVTGGAEISRWNEKNRDGSESAGFYDMRSNRQAWRLGTSYAFGGVLLSYTMEYFHKYMHRDPRAYYDMEWKVLRAKATAEVAW